MRASYTHTTTTRQQPSNTPALNTSADLLDPARRCGVRMRCGRHQPPPPPPTAVVQPHGAMAVPPLPTRCPAIAPSSFPFGPAGHRLSLAALQVLVSTGTAIELQGPPAVAAPSEWTSLDASPYLGLPCSPQAPGTTYAWRSDPPRALPASAVDPQLRLPPGTLPPGAYTLSLTARHPHTLLSAVVRFAVTVPAHGPLHARIVGGAVQQHPSGGPLTLTATATEAGLPLDPARLRVAWAICVNVTCAAHNAPCARPLPGSATGAVLTVPAPLPVGPLCVTATVAPRDCTADCAAAAAAHVSVLMSPVPVAVGLVWAPATGPLSTYCPDRDLLLQSQVRGNGTAVTEYAWGVRAAAAPFAPYNLTALDPPGSALRLPAGVIGADVVVRLNITSPQGKAVAEVRVPVARAPQGGWLAVSQVTGPSGEIRSGETLQLRAGGWQHPSREPLTYVFSYAVAAVGAIPLSLSPTHSPVLVLRVPYLPLANGAPQNVTFAVRVAGASDCAARATVTVPVLPVAGPSAALERGAQEVALRRNVSAAETFVSEGVVAAALQLLVDANSQGRFPTPAAAAARQQGLAALVDQSGKAAAAETGAAAATPAQVQALVAALVSAFSVAPSAAERAMVLAVAADVAGLQALAAVPEPLRAAADLLEAAGVSLAGLYRAHARARSGWWPAGPAREPLYLNVSAQAPQPPEIPQILGIVDAVQALVAGTLLSGESRCVNATGAHVCVRRDVCARGRTPSPARSPFTVARLVSDWFEAEGLRDGSLFDVRIADLHPSPYFWTASTAGPAHLVSVRDGVGTELLRARPGPDPVISLTLSGLQAVDPFRCLPRPALAPAPPVAQSPSIVPHAGRGRVSFG